MTVRAEPLGRWVLHRAGIRNVWQYDDAELHFAGGRLLLRGMNGAGKSKALELLLPFLLDGDTRQIDATQRDRTTVRWLMTAGRDDGDHVGYAWLELRCVDDDAVERFMTIGAGLKASTRTGKASGWYFMTDRRVGVDLALDVEREVLSVDKLRAELGDDAVVESGAEHRRRVGRLLFGLHDDARFDNLLHLLHQLRDPNVGNRVEEGNLAQLLSDALPPLDDRFLDDAAARLDDLDQVKEQVARAERAAATLTDFLSVYRGYARGKLRERAAAMTAAVQAHTRAVANAARQDATHRKAEETMDEARGELDRRRVERRVADGDRRAIEQSDAYRDRLALVDRERTVDALGAASAAASAAAEQARAAADVADAELAAAHASLADDVAGAGTAFAGARADLERGGIDTGLLGWPPTGAGSDAIERSASVTVVVQRRRERVRAVRALVAVRDAAAAEAERAYQSAAELEAELEVASAELAAADQHLGKALDSWTEAVTSWWTDAAATHDADVAALEAALSVESDAVVASVGRAVRATVAPLTEAARAAEADASAAVAVARRARDDADAVRDDLLAQTEAHPPAPAHRRAERDAATGAPFYALVDLRDGVADSDGANLEAALEAAGILDAWVTSDGLVRDVTGDVLLTVAGRPAPSGRSLTDVLVPAPDADSAVPVDTVGAVLAAIGLGQGSDTSVALDGHWQTGVLRGLHTKEVVEFVGAGARAATRRRKIQAAEAAVAARRAELDRAEASAQAATARRRSLEALADTIPPSSDVVTAADVRRQRLIEVDRIGVRHRRASDALATYQAALARARAEVDREAARDGLPSTDAALVGLDDALRDCEGSLAEVRRTVTAVDRSASARARHGAAVEEARRVVNAAVQRAAVAAADHEVAAAEVATLRAALEGTLDVLAEHARHVARIDALDTTEIPAAEGRLESAVAAHASAETERRVALERAAEASAAARDTAAALVAILSMDGVARAALDVEMDDADPEAAAAAIVAAIGPGAEVTDTLVLARFDTMEKALPGGFDAALTEDQGVKLVHVADDGGRHPLAAMTARVVDEAAETRARLADRERDVLERFLLHELVDELRSRLADAEDLVAGANRALTRVHTSHGKGVHLAWQLRDDAPDAATSVARLVADDLRSSEDDAALRAGLLSLIEAERERDPGAGYDEHLRNALSYRDWFEFRVHVTDVARPGAKPLLTKKLGLSQGEQRVLSYLALFAAAASHYDSVRREAPAAPRLLLLDDAFAKVDEPTHAQLLGHLGELDLDYILTSERLWGCFPNVPSLEIYEAVRDPAVPGVALVHYRWDGSERRLVGV